MEGLTAKEWGEVLQVAQTASPADDPARGRTHLEAVANTATALARSEKADIRLATVFGLIHDSCRNNEAVDPGHGRRASELVRKTPLFQRLLGREGADILATACEIHSEPRRHGDPRIGVCLDADRLTRGALGVKEHYLSTVAASRVLRGETNLKKSDGPSVFHVYHGSSLLEKRQVPTKGRVIYTAVDEESSQFYGETRGLLVSCHRLADLTDCMALIRTPLFDQLQEHDRSEDYYSPESGEKTTIFDILDRGDFYHNHGRQGQEGFIKEVMSWGYDAVLINDHSHSVRRQSEKPTLAVSPQAQICLFEPETLPGWIPAKQEFMPLPDIPSVKVPAVMANAVNRCVER